MATVEKVKSAYEILVEASEAAEAAVRACRPTPIVVGTPTTPFGNTIDETKETWFVEGGVCGYASVVSSQREENLLLN